MKVVSLASVKGGSTRSSTCIGLAVEAVRRGYTVAIADLDAQATAASWSDHREAEEPSVISLQATRLPHFLAQAQRAGADFVFVDGAPNAETAILAADAADLVLLPTRLSIIDIRAFSASARIARLSNKPAYAVLNCVPIRSHLMVADAAEAIGKWNMKVCPIVIHQRAVVSRSMITGQTASEVEPDGKAASEMGALFGWVQTVLNS